MMCDGSCEKHAGEVLRVHVRSATHDWGEFWYCAAAIEEDRQRGLTVETVEAQA